MKEQHIVHPIAPVYDEHSRVLILGSFPSVKSRENGFFYGHPQNRFWKVMANICDEEVPQTNDEKKALLLTHGIAVWDVISSCEIVGSSDSSIRNAVPTDIGEILHTAAIRQIYTNGKKAHALYGKYQQKETGRGAVCLPSTSPANAAVSLEKLQAVWYDAIQPNLL